MLKPTFFLVEKSFQIWLLIGWHSNWRREQCASSQLQSSWCQSVRPSRASIFKKSRDDFPIQEIDYIKRINIVFCNDVVSLFYFAVNAADLASPSCSVYTALSLCKNGGECTEGSGQAVCRWVNPSLSPVSVKINQKLNGGECTEGSGQVACRLVITSLSPLQATNKSVSNYSSLPTNVRYAACNVSNTLEIYLQTPNYRKTSSISRTKTPELKCFLYPIAVDFAKSIEARC